MTLPSLFREGVADAVHFHGAVDNHALGARYRAADVFVLPSGAEGFGLVYLEAMAHGRPVVGADAGGTPFVVRPGESGVLVPYGNVEILAGAPQGRVSNLERSLGLSLDDAGDGSLVELFVTLDSIEGLRALGFRRLDGNGLGLGGELDQDLPLLDLVDDALVDLAREQAQRQADHPRGMSDHALDGEMGLAGIGRAQHGRDAIGAGGGRQRTERKQGEGADLLARPCGRERGRGLRRS